MKVKRTVKIKHRGAEQKTVRPAYVGSSQGYEYPNYPPNWNVDKPKPIKRRGRDQK